MRFVTTLLFLILTSICIAQQPAYFKFAEKEFRGVNIYDIIQDDEHNYWFATNQGILKHDGYSFLSISCDAMKSESVFGFVKDRLGNLYCFNLQHQILRIKDDIVELYYEIPESMRFHETDITIDSKNHLVIMSKGLIRIAPEKSNIEIVTRDVFHRSNPLNIFSIGNNTTICSGPSDNFYFQKNGKELDRQVKFDLENNEKATINSWFWADEEIFGVDRSTMKLYHFDRKSTTLTYRTTLNQALANSPIRIFYSSGRLWLTGVSNGIYVYDAKFNPLYNGKLIFDDYFVSDIYSDDEGNTLLSTFDDGIIIVPDPEVSQFDFSEVEKINCIDSDENQIYISTNFGNVYSIRENLKTLVYADPEQNNIERIQFWKKRNSLLMSTSSGLLITNYDHQKLVPDNYHPGSYKHGYLNEMNSLLCAFNYGISLINFQTDGKIISDSLIMAGRSNCVAKNSSTGTIYAGMTTGVVLIDKNGKKRNLILDKKPVAATIMFNSNNAIIIGTRQHGVLIYKNDVLQRQIPFESTVQKVERYKGKLFVLTKGALYMVNVDGTNKHKLNKANGMFLDNISEFHISQGLIYVTDSRSVQYFDLDRIRPEHKEVPFRLKSVTLNGAPIQSKVLPHDLKNLIFEFGVATIRYRENIRYKYKLKGYQNHWVELPYSENKLVFNSLPAGEYTLELICMNGNSASQPIKYAFTVEKAFHEKWWFYLVIVIISGLIIAGFFLVRIRVIRKKNEERLARQKITTDLLESELKALRSQMNPHFIFNSLNSIQDLILREDTDASYDYIVLFADLVRSTLNYSNKDFIPIQKEIEFIDIYLSLEKLRFKSDFTYRIESNAPEEIMVPSMIIQPFIENALLHGLLHKSGSKTLSIQFDFDEKLLCIIEDNGIGRKKAAEIQSRRGQEHESFALDAIKKRLKILNEKLGREIGSFRFENVDNKEEDTGTRVIIELPFRREF